MRGCSSAHRFASTTAHSARSPSIRFSRPRAGPFIYALWHENFLIPIVRFGNPGVAALVEPARRRTSFSARSFARPECEIVRGSTNRGGVAAVRELLRDGCRRAAPRGHTRWSARAAARGAAGSRVSRVANRNANRPDRRRPSPAVANEELGLVRHTAAVLAGPVPVRRAAHRSARSHARRASTRTVDRLQSELDRLTVRGQALGRHRPARTSRPRFRRARVVQHPPRVVDERGGGAWGSRLTIRAIVVPPRYWAWLGTRRAVAVLLWVVAISRRGLHCSFTPGVGSTIPPTCRRSDRRVDGNGGHTQIDFGGQWVMGRMVVKGHGRELYHRQRQWEVVREGYPVEDEPPLSIAPSRHLPGIAAHGREAGRRSPKHDADSLMGWFMGTDPREWKTVGGAAVAPLAARTVRQSVRSRRVLEAGRRRGHARGRRESHNAGDRRPALSAGPCVPLRAARDASTARSAYHVFQVIASASWCSSPGSG